MQSACLFPTAGCRPATSRFDLLLTGCRNLRQQHCQAWVASALLGLSATHLQEAAHGALQLTCSLLLQAECCCAPQQPQQLVAPVKHTQEVMLSGLGGRQQVPANIHCLKSMYAMCVVICLHVARCCACRQQQPKGLVCLGGFRNIRGDYDYEGLKLELDETIYEWGTCFEIEVETVRVSLCWFSWASVTLELQHTCGSQLCHDETSVRDESTSIFKGISSCRVHSGYLDLMSSTRFCLCWTCTHR